MEPSEEIRERLVAGKEQECEGVDHQSSAYEDEDAELDEDTAVSRDHHRSGEDSFNASVAPFWFPSILLLTSRKSMPL